MCYVQRQQQLGGPWVELCIFFPSSLFYNRVPDETQRKHIVFVFLKRFRNKLCYHCQISVCFFSPAEHSDTCSCQIMFLLFLSLLKHNIYVHVRPFLNYLSSGQLYWRVKAGVHSGTWHQGQLHYFYIIKQISLFQSVPEVIRPHSHLNRPALGYIWWKVTSKSLTK